MNFLLYPIPPLTSKLVNYVTLIDQPSKLMMDFDSILADMKQGFDSLLHLEQKYKKTQDRYIKLEKNYDLNSIPDKQYMRPQYFYLFYKRSKFQRIQSEEVALFYENKARDAKELADFVSSLMACKMPARVNSSQFAKDVLFSLESDPDFKKRHFYISSLSHQINTLRGRYLTMTPPTIGSLLEDMEAPAMCANDNLGITPYTIFDRNFLEYSIQYNYMQHFHDVANSITSQEFQEKMIDLNNKFVSLFSLNNDVFKISLKCAIQRAVFDIYYINNRALDSSIDEVFGFQKKMDSFKKHTPRSLQIDKKILPEHLLDKSFDHIFSKSKKFKDFNSYIKHLEFLCNPDDIIYSIFMATHELNSVVEDLSPDHKANLAFDEFFSLFCGALSLSEISNAYSLKRFFAKIGTIKISQPLDFALITFIASIDQISENH